MYLYTFFFHEKSNLLIEVTQILQVIKTVIIFNTFFITDELVAEKERYKEIGDDLDTAFVELIL